MIVVRKRDVMMMNFSYPLLKEILNCLRFFNLFAYCFFCLMEGVSICNFSISAGTKNRAISSEIIKFMIKTLAKSCKLRRIFSSIKKIVINEAIVVRVAARIDIKAFLFFRRIIWSDITIVLSITNVKDMVIPIKEYNCISNWKR